MKTLDIKTAAKVACGATAAGLLCYAAPPLIQAYRDVGKLMGPSPREARRRRLRQDADALEIVLERRFEVRQRLQEELARNDADHGSERVEEYLLRKRERAAQILGSEHHAADRASVIKARKVLGLDAYNFGRRELEWGAELGILTSGEEELLSRMRVREAAGEARAADEW